MPTLRYLTWNVLAMSTYVKLHPTTRTRLAHFMAELIELVQADIVALMEVHPGTGSLTSELLAGTLQRLGRRAGTGTWELTRFSTGPWDQRETYVFLCRKGASLRPLTHAVDGMGPVHVAGWANLRRVTDRAGNLRLSRMQRLRGDRLPGRAAFELGAQGSGRRLQTLVYHAPARRVRSGESTRPAATLAATRDAVRKSATLVALDQINLGEQANPELVPAELVLYGGDFNLGVTDGAFGPLRARDGVPVLTDEAPESWTSMRGIPTTPRPRDPTSSTVDYRTAQYDNIWALPGTATAPVQGGVVDVLDLMLGPLGAPLWRAAQRFHAVPPPARVVPFDWALVGEDAWSSWGFYRTFVSDHLPVLAEVEVAP